MNMSVLSGGAGMSGMSGCSGSQFGTIKDSVRKPSDTNSPRELAVSKVQGISLEADLGRKVDIVI